MYCNIFSTKVGEKIIHYYYVKKTKMLTKSKLLVLNLYLVQMVKVMWYEPQLWLLIYLISCLNVKVHRASSIPVFDLSSLLVRFASVPLSLILLIENHSDVSRFVELIEWDHWCDRMTDSWHLSCKTIDRFEIRSKTNLKPLVLFQW